MGLFSLLKEKLANAKEPTPVDRSIFDFTLTRIDGSELVLGSLRGKHLLVVNTASRCGFTPQYKDLQRLHVQYQHKVAVLGFPSNDFLWQEPGNNEAIEQFCRTRYEVSFPMFEKIHVKGKNAHPLYQWLEAKTGRLPSWNFCKYFIHKDGESVRYFSSDTNPLNPTIIELINS